MVVVPGAQLCTLLEVWVLGVGMSTFDAKTSLYAEDRGIQVPMTLKYDIGHTIDSGIDLSITIDKLRVFINKTLSILSAYQ